MHNPEASNPSQNALGQRDPSTGGGALTDLTIDAPTSDQLAELLSTLGHNESIHFHKYDSTGTISDISADIDIAIRYKEDLTEQQMQVQADIEAFAAYTRNTDYMYVYRPHELHRMVEVLQILNQRNRPDFNGIESRLIDIALDYRNGGQFEMSRTRLEGYRKRMDEGPESRTGMQWDSLVTLSRSASKVIRSNHLLDNSFGEDRVGYFITVNDPKAKSEKQDLTHFYQFVADLNAADMISERSQAVEGANRETFVKNCDTINAYWTQHAAAIESIPESIKGSRFAAAYELRTMIEAMNVRLAGTQTHGVEKDYKIDPSGAISLQLKIGHVVNDVKAKLELYHATAGQPASDEITPLD